MNSWRRFARNGTSVMMRYALTLALLALALPLFAERQPYSRYQSIVDRQMFGMPPAGFDPTKNPSEISAKEERAKDKELTKEQEQVKSAVHFSVINVTPAGETAVGFTDNSDSKNPKHYYLKVGESRDGWTVKEADALAASMTIAKGEIEVSLKLGGDSASGTGTKKVGTSGGAPTRSSVLNSPSRSLGSLRERRALRERQKAADAQAAAEKERLAAEREAAREAEREAERAAEREQREKDRAEQRAQLLQMQEELRKAREERAKEKEAEAAKEGADKPSGGEES